MQIQLTGNYPIFIKNPVLQNHYTKITALIAEINKYNIIPPEKPYADLKNLNFEIKVSEFTQNDDLVAKRELLKRIEDCISKVTMITISIHGSPQIQPFQIVCFKKDIKLIDLKNEIHRRDASLPIDKMALLINGSLYNDQDRVPWEMMPNKTIAQLFSTV